MKNLVLEWFWECEEENAATEGGFKQRNKQQRIVVVGSHGQCQRWGGGRGGGVFSATVVGSVVQICQAIWRALIPVLLNI